MKYLQFLLLFTLLFACKKKKEEIQKPSVKAITSFAFLMSVNRSLTQDVQGLISNDSILLYVPKGTDITNLGPTIKYQGIQVRPAGYELQDFTNTVIYRVFGEDQSSLIYKVVVREITSAKEITNFVFKKSDNPGLTGDLTGLISGDSIEINVGYGVDVSALKPTVTFKGVSLSPGSNNPANFSAPVDYIVTADDKSTRKYTVHVVSNLMLFTKGTDGYLYAINAYDGTVKWKYFTGGDGAPTYDRGVVFAEGENHSIYAIYATSGALKWKNDSQTGGYKFSMPQAKYGKVYFGASAEYVSDWDGLTYYNDYLFCFDEETGGRIFLSQYWGSNDTAQHPLNTNITVGDNNQAFIYDFNHGMHGMNATTGVETWVGYFYKFGHANAAVSDNVLYYGSNGSIVGHSADNVFPPGWSYPVPDITSPRVFEGYLYTTSHNSLLCFSLDGNLRWQRDYVSTFYPATVFRKFVYATDTDKRFSAFDTETGDLKWSKDNFNMYPVACNGEIFLSDGSNRLNCLDGPTGNIKWTLQSPAVFPNPICILDTRGATYYVADAGGGN